MERNRSLIKSVFYIFFALCFFSFGIMLAQQDKFDDYASAEDISQTELENQNIPAYFSAKEYLSNNQESTNSLINYDTFLYFNETGTSNYLTLSLLTNGNTLAPANEIYNYVYYPDTNNTSVFYFYNINSINLFINGENQNVAMGNYITYSGLTFVGSSSDQLQSFNMTFKPYSSSGLQPNEIAITNEQGDVIEGIYTLSITYTLYTCTDGGTAMNETAFTDEIITTNYSFYVLDRESYIFNNKPNIFYSNFDHTVNISGVSDMNNAYYLYSNYSYKNDDGADKIPYIEYDYTKFELDITKSISNSTYTMQLSYDKDSSSTSPVFESGSHIAETKIYPDTTTCRVYFKDTGNYNLTLNAIQILNYSLENGQTETRKYALDGVNSITKSVLVYVYGYQITYTDKDAPLTENNLRSVSELKSFDYDAGLYKNGADITSQFLNSGSFQQSSEGNELAGDNSFTINNVISYIENNDIEPVKTNQTPINFTANAKLATTRDSYIYSTKQISSFYTKTNSTLNGESLYRKTFTGQTDNSEGLYLYIISYTFDNFYTSENNLNSNLVFYQVFYFEINKELPNIVVSTESGKNVGSDTFVNENIVIENTTIKDIYNNDVVVQIYAYDYNSKSYLSQYGGQYGISYDSLLPENSLENQVSLIENAKYTVRMYDLYSLSSTNTLITNTSGFFNERVFTIDKTPIENITARNVSEITNSTNYTIDSTLTSFSSNQSLIFSWNEKTSGASTYAYYRFFPIISSEDSDENSQFYSNNSTVLSETIRSFLNDLRSTYIPINSLLNMNTDGNGWLMYHGNTIDYNSTVSAEYVKSEAGLYLIDVYDEAGNHTVDLFMIDDTNPYFAIQNESDGSYELTSSSVYVTAPATLYWAENKAMYIANFKTINYNSSYNPDNITAEVLQNFDFYKTYDGKTSTEIFKLLYNKLYQNNYMQALSSAISVTPETDGTSAYITNYSGMYITIPINPVSYYIDNQHPDYTYQTGVYSQNINIGEEMTYRVLIRDLSNTKYDLAYSETNVVQYTNYYSARQTIIISFDSSEFFIVFTNSSGEAEPLTSNNVKEETITVDGDTETRRTKTTYLSPTRMNTIFELSYYPTVNNEDIVIQVDSVKIRYYPYVKVCETIGGVEFYSYKLSDSYTESVPYQFDGTNSNTSLQRDEFQLDGNNITSAGKYEIIRTYRVDGDYSYNENDFYQRTYVLYVDRYDVVTDAELVNETNGNSHLESLVGGDIFISMYDNKTNASLVVNYPNSDSANSNSSSLHNNGSIISPILTTNLLPLNIYVPKYKYTSYVNRLSTLTRETPLFENETLTTPTAYTIPSGTTVVVLSTNENVAKIEYEGGSYYIDVSLLTNYDFKVYYKDFYVLTSDLTLYNDASLTSLSSISLSANTKIEITNVNPTSTEISYQDATYFIPNSSYALVNEDNFYYGSNSIKEYALYAEIYKDGTTASNLIAVSSTNPSNPTYETISSNENGFLKFYRYENGAELPYLYEAGTYYVRIYQGRFGTEVGENSYQQYLTFAFEIKSSLPDFTVQSTSNTILNSVSTTPEPTDENMPKLTYYTNQSIVTLVWDTGSTYMAEIDMDEIVFRTNNGTVYTVEDDIFNERPTVEGNSYVSQLDLRKLNIYQHGGYVDITMQFKNHDGRFYSKMTKRISVDLSAPSTNVQNLVQKSISGNMIAPLTNSALRTYYTADMQQTKDLQNTSYNISNGTGMFAYYSYSVNSNYLQTLTNSLGSDVYNIYIRSFTDSMGNNTKYTDAEQETSPTNFNLSAFTTIQNFSGFENGKYYEIVEMDMAGNMSIYTVYITYYPTDNTTDENYNDLISYTNAENEELAYTIEDYNLTNSYNNATHNIYSKTGFALQNINYFGDVWAQIKLVNTNLVGQQTTSYLMLTPWDPGFVYAFVGSNYTRLSISSLIDGGVSSRYKNSLTIYNRENLSLTTFYINIRNTNITATLTDDQNREFIRFPSSTDSSIQNSLMATTYITSLQITANGELIYEQTNKLGYANLWSSNANVNVLANSTTNTITFEINQSLGFVANTRIVYEFTDNYGTKYTEIHLYKEPIISQEITSQQDLYSYYDNTNGRLYYITQNGLQYNYNPYKYTVEVYDLVDGAMSNNLTKATLSRSQNSQGISIITISTNTTNATYNDSFAIVVRDYNNKDVNTNLVKTIYFTLYKELPTPNNTTAINQPGQFKITDGNQNNITQTIINGLASGEAGYFSSVRIQYAKKDTFIPVVYSISTDKINWRELEISEDLTCSAEQGSQTYYLKIWYDEDYLLNDRGTPTYVFGYVPESQIYEFTLSAEKSTYWIEKTVGGITTIVERSNTVYTTPNGGEYANHYIVDVSYTNKNAITIQTNKEQGITATLLETFTDTPTVSSELWRISNDGDNLGNTPPYGANIVITYIPNSDNFVEEFYTYNLSGIIDTSENLVNATSKSVVISENYSSINRIELQWSKYYGIEENEINIRLVKDGVQLDPVVYSRKTNGKMYNYIYLIYSGHYTISLYDNAGNVQRFNRGNPGQTETLSFIFLKDVPFTVTYTNPETGEEETSLPIKQAIYNGAITLKIDKNTRSEFYSLDGYPTISVKKDGSEYNGTFQDDTTYIFTESGYYEITFSATSNIPDVGKIRQETYQFTIINPNGYKFSHVYNKYSNYYVERVIKDNVDITEQLVKTLDVSKITVNGITYLAELPLSYLDEKTGAGTYLITINTNNKQFKNSTLISSYTYQVKIQVGNSPIRISTAEGNETTDTITITFNQANLYSEMGESTIRILKNYKESTNEVYNLKIDGTSTDTITTSLTEAGTYYIQIWSADGSLQFSYRVVKKDPLNAAAIISIVIAVIVAIIIVIIIIKLRKRISVK